MMAARWRCSTTAMTAAMTLLDAEAWQSDGALARSSPGRIGRDVLRRLREASEITPAALGGARRQAARWRATLSKLWDHIDLLAAPTRAVGSFAQPQWQRLEQLRAQRDPDGGFHTYLGLPAGS